MANIFSRLFGSSQETRATKPSIPAREATIVTPDTALSLTAVYRSTQIIATPVSKMDIKTFRYAGGVESEIQNPLLVNKPNIDQTRREFFFQTVISLAMTGECFWYKQYGTNGQVNNLIILPSNAVGVRTEDNSGRIVFDYDGKTYTGREIEHLKLFSQVGHLRGLGPIQSCRPDIAAALDLRSYAANWFNQSGVPTGVLTTNAMITEEQAESVTDRWTAKQAERKVAVLGNGFDYKPVALSPKDAMFTDVQIQSVQAIARLFGIPPRLLLTGVDGTSDTYTNLSDENQIFYRHTLIAYTDTIEDALSNCLPRGTRVKFDFETLFKADISTRYAYYKVAVDGGWMTPEEVAAKEGLV